MHSIYSMRRQIFLRLLLANAYGTTSYSQIRSSDFPPATDTANLINSQASSAYSQLQVVTSLPLSASIQGYGLKTNASSSSLYTNLSLNVLSGIADSCVLKTNYYGGLHISQHQMFSFSNTTYLQNLILSEFKISQAPARKSSPVGNQGIDGEFKRRDDWLRTTERLDFFAIGSTSYFCRYLCQQSFENACNAVFCL